MSDYGIQLMERHTSLYFSDGNVVLLASRPGQPGLLFAVHKSVLSSHSPVLSDMFDICSSPGETDHANRLESPISLDMSDVHSSSGRTEADDFYDGMPLVRMPDDANRLESVLKILYYQSTLPWTPRSPHYPILIAPILDLSRKYGIDRIREQILMHLESDWPKTLRGWDKLEREIEFTTSDSNTARLDDSFPEPAAAIELARRFDIPSILPAAFYHLSRLSILDDWDKTHADASICTRNPTKRTARWGLLSAQDLRCLLLGKAELAESLPGYIKTEELRHKPTHVGKGTGCTGGEGIWKDTCDRCLQSADPLALLLQKSIAHEFEWAGLKACRTCTTALRAMIPAVRAQIWERLGDLFHLKDE